MLFNSLLGLGILSTFLKILIKFFSCKCIYEDTKSRGDKNAFLWVVLVIIFDVIPLAIYFIYKYLRNEEYISCPHCGKMVSQKYPICMFCKQPVNSGEKSQFISESVKKYLIFTAILYVMDLVVSGIVNLMGSQRGMSYSPFIWF